MNFIKYIIIALVSCFMFSSCEDCKTCEPDIDWIWDDGMSQAEIDATDATFQLLYGMNAEDWYTSQFLDGTSDPIEYCGEALDQMESQPSETVPGVAIISVICK